MGAYFHVGAVQELLVFFAVKNTGGGRCEEDLGVEVRAEATGLRLIELFEVGLFRAHWSIHDWTTILISVERPLIQLVRMVSLRPLQ